MSIVARVWLESGRTRKIQLAMFDGNQWTQSGLTAFHFQANRLLLPIDITKCPLGVVALANQLTKRHGAEVILLYVVEYNTSVAQCLRLYKFRREQAKVCLRKIGDQFLKKTITGVYRVRFGCPSDEIIAQAVESGVDLLLLPVFPPTFWNVLVQKQPCRTSRELTVRAPCRIFAYEAHSKINYLTPRTTLKRRLLQGCESILRGSEKRLS